VKKEKGEEAMTFPLHRQKNAIKLAEAFDSYLRMSPALEQFGV